jgi:nucleoid DNA-binding protein
VAILAAGRITKETNVKTADLIDHVAQEASIGKGAAQKAAEAAFAGIVAAAKGGEEVNLPGFGKFKVKDSAAARAATRPPARRSRSQHRASSGSCRRSR